MKIGYVPPKGAFVSIDYERHLTAAALSPRHELRTYPAEYSFAAPARRRELLREWVSGCEAFIGTLDVDVLEARREIDRCIPWAIFMMGRMPRGAVTMPDKHRYLHTHDVFLCNSTPDVVLGRKFFPNGIFRVVPFPIDETQFFPSDEETKAATRASLGLAPEHKILLYSGRITLEKNVHTILRTFRVVLNAVPNARLVLAGQDMNSSFPEFGSQPVAIKRTLTRLIDHLGLADHVVFIGQRGPADLRALYGTADVLVNMTLHHDENFGFAQVEAMACGLPVVGTTWGGLKDSITDGVTGRHAPALLTVAGMKVDWWSAANSIVHILTDDEAANAMRREACQRARDHYSVKRFGERVDEVFRECLAETARACEPLQVSEFANEFWATCLKSLDSMPPYRRGPNAQRLYQELIAPYACETNGKANGGGRAWCLAVPVSMQPDGSIAVNDPIVPRHVAVPPPLADAVRILVDRFVERPVLGDESLEDTSQAGRDALAWMHQAGLVLASCKGTIDPALVPSVLGQPAFVLQQVDHRADVVWLS